MHLISIQLYSLFSTVKNIPTVMYLYFKKVIFSVFLQPSFGIIAPDSALLFVVLSPVSAYYKTGSDGAVSIYADPNVVRAFPGGVGNRKVGSNYGPTISKIILILLIYLYLAFFLPFICRLIRNTHLMIPNMFLFRCILENASYLFVQFASS